MINKTSQNLLFGNSCVEAIFLSLLLRTSKVYDLSWMISRFFARRQRYFYISHGALLLYLNLNVLQTHVSPEIKQRETTESFGCVCVFLWQQVFVKS